MLSKKNIYYSITIFFLNIFLRIPSLFQELPPNTFCDEDEIIDKAFHRYQQDQIYFYGVGQINYYLAASPSYIYEAIVGEKPSKRNFIVFARIAGVIVLNSISAVIMFFIGLLLFNSLPRGLLLSFLYTFSPMILGVSRIFYPDHFIIICSTLCLFLSLIIFKGIGPLKLNLIMCSLVIAIASSIKISGAILVIPFTFAVISYFLRNSYFSVPSKDLIYSLLYLYFFTLIFFLIFNPFLFIEGYYPLKKYIIWKKESYSKNVFYLEANNPYLFYSNLVLIISAGWVSFSMFCLGFYNLYKTNRMLLILLMVCPISLILILGQSNVVTTRNPILAVPFILPIIIIGFDEVFNRIELPYLKFLFILILMIEPLYKSFISFHNDLQIDSRIKAKHWIYNNIPEDSIIASNQGCFQPFPFDIERYNAIGLKFSSEIQYLDNYENIDYLVMDSWFGDMIDAYKHKSEQKPQIIFIESIFNNLHYINAGGVFHKEPYNKSIKRNKSFRHIKTIKGYGPKIFIYQNINHFGKFDKEK